MFQKSDDTLIFLVAQSKMNRL